MGRWLLVMVWTVVISLIMLSALPAAAQEQIDSLPTVNEFSAAHFDLLTTLEIADSKAFIYGSGTTILPDRVSMWIGSDDSDKLFYYVQVGTVTYSNDGSGWKRADDLPPGSSQSVSISDQLSKLEENANAILDIGAEPVRGVAAEHYQIWLSGDRLLELDDNTSVLDNDTIDLIKSATYKVDLWIGQSDGLLHQQNVVLTFPDREVNNVTVPGVQLTSLITFYDFNDPAITIQPPI